MIDIETMGVVVPSPIFAVGAVYFDINGIYETFYEKASIQSSVDRGINVSIPTMLWWMQQSESARAELKGNEQEQSIENLLDKFALFYKSKTMVFGNGSDFDCAHMANAYMTLKKAVPWKYYHTRCYRTLISANRRFNIDPIPKNEKEHCALDDAVWQAKNLINVWQVTTKTLKA